jgi:hypothetical protein
MTEPEGQHNPPKPSELAELLVTAMTWNHAESLGAAESAREHSAHLKSGGLRAVRVRVPLPASFTTILRSSALAVVGVFAVSWLIVVPLFTSALVQLLRRSS